MKITTFLSAAALVAAASAEPIAEPIAEPKAAELNQNFVHVTKSPKFTCEYNKRPANEGKKSTCAHETKPHLDSDGLYNPYPNGEDRGTNPNRDRIIDELEYGTDDSPKYHGSKTDFTGPHVGYRVPKFHDDEDRKSDSQDDEDRKSKSHDDEDRKSNSHHDEDHKSSSHHDEDHESNSYDEDRESDKFDQVINRHGGQTKKGPHKVNGHYNFRYGGKKND